MVEIIKSNSNEFDKMAFEVVKSSLNQLLEKQKHVVFGICGGDSIKGVFELFKEYNEIDWKGVHIFMVDEWVENCDNFDQAKELFIDELLSKGLIGKDNLHAFIYKKSDNDVYHYKHELQRFGGKFDLVLLSSGEDSHVASLFPSHFSISNKDDYFFVMHDSPKKPMDRMTASKNLLLKSKIAVLLFKGESKKEAYKRYLDKDVRLDDCPCKIVNHIEKSFVIVD